MSFEMGAWAAKGLMTSTQIPLQILTNTCYFMFLVFFNNDHPNESDVKTQIFKKASERGYGYPGSQQSLI